jgi:hypothetical protein
MQRTLKRECKGLEIAKREAVAASIDASHWGAALSASAACAEDRGAGGGAGTDRIPRACTAPPFRARGRGSSFEDADEMAATDPS